MDKLPKIGDYLYIDGNQEIIRHLKVVAIEECKIIKESMITVDGNYGRTYREPLWIFTGVE